MSAVTGIKVKPKYLKQLDEISSNLSFTPEIIKLLESDNDSIRVKVLSGSLKSFLIASIWNKKKRNILILTEDNTKASGWFNDLEVLIETESIALLIEAPSTVRLKTENLDESNIWLVDGLSSIQKNEYSISITTPTVLQKAIPKPESISGSIIRLEKNSEIDFTDLINQLALNGFEKKDYVSFQGDMAVRGGILDLFPIGWENPLRIEFWGDTIESIRQFEPLSQRSIGNFENVEFISSIFHSTEGIEQGDIFDYIPKDTLIVVDYNESADIDAPETAQFTEFKKLYLNTFGKADFTVHSSPQPFYQHTVKDFIKDLKHFNNENFKIIISAEGKIHLQRFREIIENAIELAEMKDDENNQINAVESYNEHYLKNIIWLEKDFFEGFILEQNKIACFTEHQIFSRKQVLIRSKKYKQKQSISLKEVKQLNIGDYLVHEEKGICKFNGFQTIQVAGKLQDCIKLIFADDGTLYVNLNYLHLIQKYNAADGVVPKLSRLGTNEWKRKKAKAKQRLRELAFDLIKLYAKRKEIKGIAYPVDNIWQKELEASFIYEDTIDQAETTDAVKKDMESETPMDRLVCGDVGFGKTEIAIRAAFKAVQAGKQVAVLVPTTILAEQHFITFSDRMKQYPIIIDSLSRFKSKNEQQDIVKKLKEGKVDILIGTHRILSKDIAFKDLGLLIIDEEHRFGVGAKESLRAMKANVDTLTLTATPIPRTLNFSLLGARDLSVIETPPRNRIPTVTEIIEWNNKTIIEATKQEIERGGQVFFVTDRVNDIDRIAMDLQQLLPTLRIGVAHGQLKTSELEKVMEKFLAKKIDVLLATKIIESGLDIPNANTIFINRAHHFGLAELYQLRGRVGRSNIQAYCYLLVPPIKTIGGNTLKRLLAIEEFTELGSGFNLAMRDMEIRGAGDLLGPQQSGFINEIGFDLYQKILDEAVKEIKIEEFPELFKELKDEKPNYLDNSDLAIEINTDAYLPGYYISNNSERFLLYKKLYETRSNADLQQIVNEMKDCYGKLPKEAYELVFSVKLRISALDTGIKKLILKEDKLIVEFPFSDNEHFYKIIFPELSEFFVNYENLKILENNNKITATLLLKNRDEAVEFLWRIKRTIETIGE